MRKTWFTSDQHFGHFNIIRLAGRPFKDVSEMEDTLVSRFNERVAEGDLVFHLGDFVWNVHDAARVITKLHGEHWLVSGNHDKSHVRKEKHEKTCRYLVESGFTRVIPDRLVICAKPKIVLCHFPPASADDPKDVRYVEWRPKLSEFDFLVHGHVHEKWKYSVNSRSVNVGVDVWNFAPVSWEEISEGLAAPKDCEFTL